MNDALKRAAAEKALDDVKPGMKLGIGTGSTADLFTKALGAKVRGGLDIIGVPTSERTRALAEKEGIRLSTLDELGELDLTIDGADEIGPGLDLIKGGGGALLREKIVASASRRMIVIADGTKVVPTLGAFPLPIEVVAFGLAATRAAINTVLRACGLDGALELRGDADHPFVTDGGHYILDAHLAKIPEPAQLAPMLVGIPGVVDHGLFINLAEKAYVAGQDGVETLTARA
ncbi:ribose-5-phosphate isomerase [Roseibium hamelinense]|uniref:Ribose-5-phosphate isomerase A n=1 Tax=Roseibium hamelinense TaxID=150831 RepID=A0A562T8R5_9HYPH|nr:ribose-5-phosphate isomerase RpiA [Roseibium hamelinense]MTI43552.1 ribose-5-phosphate isomerase RpiA [Roseibium hamelinense]TWI89654.1 ribose-5-phosphate isomerase [Roseibium hamelinense]